MAAQLRQTSIRQLSPAAYLGMNELYTGKPKLTHQNGNRHRSAASGFVRRSAQTTPMRMDLAASFTLGLLAIEGGGHFGELALRRRRLGAGCSAARHSAATKNPASIQRLRTPSAECHDPKTCSAGIASSCATNASDSSTRLPPWTAAKKM